MANIGMDTAAAQQTVGTFRAESANLTASIRKVQGAFERTWWEGSDKQAFVDEWATSRGQLEKAAVLLLDAANKLDKNRQEQESTSGR